MLRSMYGNNFNVLSNSDLGDFLNLNDASSVFDLANGPLRKVVLGIDSLIKYNKNITPETSKGLFLMCAPMEARPFLSACLDEVDFPTLSKSVYGDLRLTPVGSISDKNKFLHLLDKALPLENVLEVAKEHDVKVGDKYQIKPYLDAIQIIKDKHANI
jgi:hypothetical protein